MAFGKGMTQRKLSKTAAAVLFLSAPLLLSACEKEAEVKTGRIGPSGLPVPRYVALKFDEVNARAGPGEDHKVLWVYRTKGLPVQVVAETRDWRRVCDPEGGLAWVKGRVTDGRRTVMRVQEKPVAMRAQPKLEAKTEAYLSGKAIASLDRCEGGWCRVKAGGRKGWTPENELWGVDPKAQCR